MTRASQTRALGRPGLRDAAGAVPGPLLAPFAVAVAGVGFAAWSTVAPTSGTAALTEPVQVGTLLVAALLCLARPLLVRTERAPWTFLGLAMLAWAIGEVIWAVTVADRHPAPVVSIADAGYLPCYPLLYVGLVLLIRAKAAPFPPSVWVDGLIGALGLGSVVLALAYQPIVDDTGRSPASVAIVITYPVGDVVLVGLVLLAVSVAGFREATWWLIAVGGAMVVLADVTWLLQSADDAPASTGWPNVLWPLAAVLFAAAAWQRPVPVRTLRLQSWPALAMPAVSVVGALTVLVVATRRPLPVAAVVLAVLSVAGALVRAAMTVREARATAATQHHAVTDELTGLGNRRLLLSRLDTTLAGRAADHRHALLLLDLDRFKEVNDTLGHPVGDELLRRLGPRLAATAEPGQTLARLGGDEFGILVPQVSGQDAALAAAGRVLDALARPFVVDGLTLYVAASIGIAIAPDHGEDGVTLLRCADVAMYEAKRERTRCAVYHTRSDRHTRSRLASAAALRRSLAAGQLRCHFQPQVDLVTGTVVGFEALARWQHPQDGLLGPDEFLMLAEQTGLMAQLTDVVLADALAECRRWRARDDRLRVSVNLAASMLLDAGLVDRVATAVHRAGLPAAALIVEITEETLVADAGRARTTLAALHALGVSVSIDDYGVGYSSLSYLRDLPADELKLDRSFVTAMPADSRARAIVRYTVELAHALGVAVVAEGVEDGDTLRVLRDLRCDRVQGHYIAHPMDAELVAGWLDDQAGPPIRNHDGDFTRVQVTLEP